MAGKSIDRWTPEGKKFMKEIQKLGELEVRIGIQGGSGDTNLVNIALWNELGTANIPARPFIRNTADNNKDKIATFGASRASQLADGVSGEMILDKIGTYCKGLMQKEIKDGDFVPNAQSTIRQKGSDHPLIDTGRMRQSVNFVVKKKGSE